MKPSGHVYLFINGGKYDLARRVVDAAATRYSLAVRVKAVQGRQLRQLSLPDASLSVAIAVFGGVVAPSVNNFISEIKSRLRRMRHSVTISAELATTIGQEIVARFAERGPKARLMSLEEIDDGKGFKLLFRRRDKVYTIRLNQHGALESWVRR